MSASPTGPEPAWQGGIQRLPLLVFFGIYLPSCYVGAILFLLPGMWIQPALPALTRRDVLVVLVLLNVAPALLWVAAEGGFRLVARLRPRHDPSPTLDPGAPLLGWLVLLAALVVAGWSLHRAEALSFLGGWSNHRTYLHARWHLMARLTFFEFVNLYTVLPLAGAYLMLVQKRRWATVLVAALVGLAQFPLAQRRVLLTSALLIGAALYIHWFVGGETSRHGHRRAVWALLGGAAALWALFLILTLQWEPLQTAMYGLAMRYAFPAIVYPLVFPRILPYYHVDIALDMVGIGRMPDDSIRVHQVLQPGSDYTITAPFQFVLYSQGGVIVALAGSIIVGAWLGGCWAAVLGLPRRTAIRSLLGALVITFGAYLAMDSARDALTVSYGVAWGGLVVGFLHVASLAGRIVGTGPSPRPKGSQ